MRLLYFAWVRQKIGRGEEEMSLPAGVVTIGGLLEHLCRRGGGYAEALADTARLRFARNQEHAGPDAGISDSDEVAIFPPVTGG